MDRNCCSGNTLKLLNLTLEGLRTNEFRHNSCLKCVYASASTANIKDMFNIEDID